jgi:hypothetical protein
MDINKIRAVYNLTEEKYPTEESVLNYVQAREQELANSIAARETAESNLETANNTIAERDCTRSLTRCKNCRSDC